MSGELEDVLGRVRDLVLGVLTPRTKVIPRPARDPHASADYASADSW